MTMKYKEIYDIVVPVEKRKEEKHNIFGHYIGRPISVLMTIPLVNKKVKPTDITKLSIVFLIVAFGLLSFGKSIVIKLIGWSCFFIWNLLDGVDGNLARCTNQCSEMGDLWDTVAGYAALVLTYFSVGIAAYYDCSTISFLENYVFIILGGIAAIASIFHRLVFQKKMSYSTYNRDRAKIKEGLRKSGKISSLTKIYTGNITAPTGLMQIYLLVAIIFHLLNVFITIYAFLTVLEMLASLYKLLGD